MIVLISICPGYRERTDGKFSTAKTLVPECLYAVTSTNIRRYFQHCYRYMDAYRLVSFSSSSRVDL